MAEGRDRWAARYEEAQGPDKAASSWLIEAAQRLPPDAMIVDIAGGRGRHARPLLAEGRRCVLVDFVESALRLAVQQAPALPVVAADAWALPFADATLDAILVANFLERDLFPAYHALLKPGGFLLYETYPLENAVLVAAGEARAPRSPRYMLEPGELRTLVAPLEILDYREGIVSDAAGRRASASVLARKRAVAIPERFPRPPAAPAPARTPGSAHDPR
jgi:hypothetical protein